MFVEPAFLLLIVAALLAYLAFMLASAVSERVTAFGSKAMAKVRSIMSPAVEALKPIVSACASTGLDFFREYAPLLRSRTLANATVLKALGVLGWVIPVTAHNWIVTALVLIGMSVAFANVVIGRKNSTGPIIQPGDLRGAPAGGPGAELERQSVQTVSFGGDKPRTLPV